MSDKPTIADISMTGYLYYPAEEFGFDIAKDHPAIGAWLERMKALPGWKHPYRSDARLSVRHAGLSQSVIVIVVMRVTVMAMRMIVMRVAVRMR